MQKTKDNIRHLLVQVAKEAFCTKGYTGVSMREIAKQSGVGLSNIYNYFNSKDELYEAVLEPLIFSLKKKMDEHNNEKHLTLQVFHSKEFQHQTVTEMVALAANFRLELRLLFFKSHGSPFENYKQQLIEQQWKMGQAYIAAMKERFHHLNCEISPLFLQIATRWWISLLEQVALIDMLNTTNLERLISEYVCFSTAGWQALMKA